MVDCVCGVDPGGTTGLILCDLDGSIVDSAEKVGVSDVASVIRMWKPGIVVIENFIPSRRVDNSAMEIIGAVALVAHDLGITMEKQNPSVLASFRTKDAGPSPHINSALAHVRYHLAKRRYLDATRESRDR